MSRDRYPESAWVFYFMKKCNKCKEEKSLDDFNKDKSRIDGYAYACKKCSNKFVKDYYENNIETVKEKRKEYELKTKKERQEYYKQYRENNKEIIKEKAKYYNRKNWIENKEKIKENRKIHQQNNPDLYKAYWENFLKNNPQYLKQHAEKTNNIYPERRKWRNVLNSTLKRFKRDKTSSTKTLLGYSAQELKEHLDKLGMNWKTDHIDHKIPITWFKPETPCYVVNDLRNLQPLEESINKTKLNFFMTPVSLEYLNIAKEWIKEEYYNKLVF